jgi:tetratricopeptide (TPR) repeat protein
MPNPNKTAQKPFPRKPPAASVRRTQALVAFAGAAAIAAAAVFIYLPSISGGFILDDNHLLTESLFVKSADGLYFFWCTTRPVDYWPMTNTTFWLEWRMWGMHPTGYHFTNLILHIVESWLIWIILRKINIPGAFWAALIYAVHPVNVEATAWIAQRKETTAMLFFLLSMLWYCKAGGFTAPAEQALAGRREEGREWEKSRFSSFILHPSSFGAWYWLSLTAFVLAMFGKGSVAILPLLILWIMWWLRPAGTGPVCPAGNIEPSPSGAILEMLKRFWPPYTRRDIVWIAPFFLVAAVLVWVNIWFQTHGTGEIVRTCGFLERLLGACGAVWFYLYKAFFPLRLCFVYPQWEIAARELKWWAAFAGLLAVTAVLWWYGKTWSRPLLFAWGFFGAALLPVLGFTDIGFMKFTLVADRYQHIALIGMITLTAAGLGTWMRRTRGRPRTAATALALLAVGSLAFLAFRQSSLYRDAQTLYPATISLNPDCWLVRNNLGGALYQKARDNEAMQQLEKAKELYNEAMRQFDKAVRLNPDYADARSNLAVGFIRVGRFNDAIKQCEEALRIKHNQYPEAHHNLGISLSNVGRPVEAIEHFKQALAQTPSYPDAENAMGSALVQIGRYNEALEHVNKALKMQPNLANAEYNLGSIYKVMGKYQESLEHYARAVQMKRNEPIYHMALGEVLNQVGRYEEAIAQYRQALQLNSNVPEAHYDLAIVYANAHNAIQAVASARRAMDLARSQEQTALALKIEAWLEQYQGAINRNQGQGK